MQRQGVCLTQNDTTTDDENEPILPPPRSHTNRKHNVGAHLFDLKEDLQGMISSNFTGRFLFTSSQCMTYLFVLYDFNSNAILACPIKSRRAQDIITGYELTPVV
jgi:hypothetical protein